MRTAQISGSRGPITMSKIVLGASDFGSKTSPEDAFRLMDAYYAAGGRTLDTARIYGGFTSEKIIGDWLEARGVRDEITLVTKGGHPPMGHMHTSRLSAECIREDIEASLNALRQEYVDVYFLHRDDTARPVSEIMDTLYSLVESGRVRALGASNWSLKRILEANRYAVEAGKTPFSVSQIQWSLAVCTSESWGDDTLLCMTDEEYLGYKEAGIPVMAFSSQARGLFSKYIAGGQDALKEKVIRQFLGDASLKEINLARVEKVRRVSEQTGLSPAAISLGYLTCNPLECFPVISCSNLKQLEDSLSAADLQIDTALLLD